MRKFSREVCDVVDSGRKLDKALHELNVAVAKAWAAELDRKMMSLDKGKL